MKHPGRPIGAHIRAICAWLEDNGPATSAEIQRGTGILPQSLAPSCARAVCFGFVACQGKFPRTFWVLPGWQDKIGSRDRPKLPRYPGELKDKERVNRSMSIPRVNSVWNLGA